MRTTVKKLRFLLLVLLAMLLPLRGAVAAAMLCPPSAHGVAAAQAPHHSGGGHGHHGHADHGHERYGHERHAHPAHGAEHAMEGAAMDAHPSADPADPAEVAGAAHADGSRCQVCASFCSMTPLPSALPTLHAPPFEAAARFPAPAVPPLSFLSGGPERPPRSI